MHRIFYHLFLTSISCQNLYSIIIFIDIITFIIGKQLKSLIIYDVGATYMEVLRKDAVQDACHVCPTYLLNFTYYL